MRADLRLSDLERKKVPSKLMNVKVPDNVSDGIDRVAEELGCSKTAVVIALLNEGLDAAKATLPPRASRPGQRSPRRGRPPLPLPTE